jgi:hypothetical protein
MALAAQPVGPFGNRAAWALTVPLIGECGDEVGLVHGSSFHSGDSSASWRVNLR